MTDLRVLAMGIYKLTQAVSIADVTCQEFVLTSMAFAEVSVEDSPMRKEQMAEFQRICKEGA